MTNEKMEEIKQSLNDLKSLVKNKSKKNVIRTISPLKRKIRINCSMNKKSKTRTINTVKSSDYLSYEIYYPDHPEVVSGDRQPDDLLVILIKEEINKSEITRERLLEFVGSGEDYLFENANQAYNLEYGLRTRSNITSQNVYKWALILDKKLKIEFVEED